MLVLSRKVGETIELPSLGITIQVSKIKPTRTLIGIDAPGEVEILRGEKRNDTNGSLSDATGKPRRTAISSKERTLNEQLMMLEAEIVALSEMASEEHDQAAKITARESLCRLRKLRRGNETEAGVGEASPTNSMADFVAVRSEVLQHLMQERDSAEDQSPTAAATATAKATATPTAIVRQSSEGYEVNGSHSLAATEPVKPSDWDASGYQVA